MTAAPFQPIGEVSRRVMVVDEIGCRERDTVITYEELHKLLDTDDRRIVQAAVNSAKPAMGREHSKAVVAVAGAGYRIVHANEHIGIARHHQGKSRRQLARSRSVVQNVDFSGLTEGERAACTLAVTSLALQLDYMRRNDIRSSRLEAAVETVQTTQERSDADISELKARLGRLESSMKPA